MFDEDIQTFRSFWLNWISLVTPTEAGEESPDENLAFMLLSCSRFVLLSCALSTKLCEDFLKAEGQKVCHGHFLTTSNSNTQSKHEWREEKREHLVKLLKVAYCCKCNITSRKEFSIFQKLVQKQFPLVEKKSFSCKDPWQCDKAFSLENSCKILP